MAINNFAHLFPGQDFGQMAQTPKLTGMRASQVSANSFSPDFEGFEGSYQSRFNPSAGNLGPSFSTTPGKQARRQTKLNYRIENMLGRFDDFAQGQGRGLDTLISNALASSINPEASKSAQSSANMAGEAIANQVAEARRAVQNTLGARGLGSGVTSPFLQQQLALQGQSQNQLARRGIFDSERERADRLIGALMGLTNQRAGILSGLNFTGYKAPSEWDKAAPVVGGLLGAAGQVGGAMAGAGMF